MQDSRRRRSLDPNLRHSLSSFRPLGSASQDQEKYAASDAAVRLARDQFAQELEQQRLRTKSSFLSLKRRHHSPKIFRTSMRSNSIDNNGNDLNASQQAGAVPASDKGMGRRARSFSTTIKSRLKRVFYRQAHIDAPLPTQQLEATKAHFRDYLDKLDSSSQNDKPVSDEVLPRVGAYDNSAEIDSPFLDRPIRTTSLRSVNSEGSLADTQSRVTSWANSTNAESILPYHPLEKKRLSVIQEQGGPHQPSSSVMRHGILGPAYSAFSKPLQNRSTFNDSIRLPDSQLIRDVLQKRLENHDQAEAVNRCNEDQSDEVDWSMRALPAPPLRKSSKTGHKNLLNSWAEEDESKESPSSQADSQASVSVIRKALPHMSDDDIFKPQDTSTREENSSASLRTVSFSESSFSGYDDGAPRHPTKRPLRDVRSTFFPPSTHIERHSTSPYRRAMQSSSADQSTTDVETDKKKPAMFLDVPDSVPHTQAFSATDSGSVYSRSTDGNTPRPGQGPASGEQLADESVRGTASVIRDDSSPKILGSSGHIRGHSSSSAKSSGDWKTWMATEVATLDHYPPKGENLRRRRLGHVRGDAEIHSDDEMSIETLEKDDSASRHLAETLVAEATKHRSLSPQLRRSPLSEIGLASRVNETTPVHRENAGIHGRRSFQGQNENVRPNHGILSAKPLRLDASRYSLTPKDMSPTPKSRLSNASPFAPSRETGSMSDVGVGNEQLDSECTRRLNRIRSSLSSTSQVTPEAQKSPDRGTDQSLPAGQSMINFVMGKVRQNISMVGKENGDAAFL